ncbi:MAG TPA: glycosyltransferase family A protein [Candidatus Acidoferrales bacterium]|nr:glycosyltransferase family A protein [Candidatus Acidoferrales bacterium]
MVITPVRDEGVYLKFTIESMIAQTIRPAEWVIVNDGSTDNTGTIIDEYAHQHPWIRAVHWQNCGCRKADGGIVGASNDGYRAASSKGWEFIVKLYGDLTVQPDYFARCIVSF